MLTAAGSHPLESSSTGAYFRFRGFVIEDAPGTSGGNVDLYGNYVEISGNEIRGQDQGIYTAEESHHAHILGNWIHHNGEGVTHQSHGIYLQGDDHLVANNLIHDHPEGFGIQVYDKGDRAIVTGNTITGAGHSGIVVGGSGGVSGVHVHNNVLAFNNQWGICHDSSCPTSSVADHNVTLRQRLRADPVRLLGPQLRRRQPHGDPLFVNYAAGTSTSRRAAPRSTTAWCRTRRRPTTRATPARTAPARMRVRSSASSRSVRPSDLRLESRVLRTRRRIAVRLANRAPMRFGVPPLRPSTGSPRDRLERGHGSRPPPAFQPTADRCFCSAFCAASRSHRPRLPPGATRRAAACRASSGPSRTRPSPPRG